MSTWQDGSPDSDILVVGMAPGREELSEGRPFVGASGRLLWALFKRAGISRSDCFILNTIPEWPNGKNGDPTPEQLDAHWDAFNGAARDFRGRFVVLLGGAALSRYCGLPTGISDWRGYIIRPDGAGVVGRATKVCVPYKSSGKGHKKGDPRWVKTTIKDEWPLGQNVEAIFPALHPAAIIRTGFSSAPLLAGDLARVGRAHRGELLVSRAHYEEVATIPAQGRAVVVDIETPYTDDLKKDIERIGFATDTSAWTRPWDSSTRDASRAILGDEKRTVVGHNLGAFDIPQLTWSGCPIKGEVWDTMLGAAFLQPDLLKGLNAAASMYLDCERWKHTSVESPAFYNATDCIRTYELWQQEKQIMEERGQLKLFEGTICKGLPTLADMFMTGIKVDLSAQQKWIKELEGAAESKLLQWSTQTGGVNLNSPMQLKKFFKSLGMELKPNKYGSESTDKLALANLKAEYPQHGEMLSLLLDTRHVLKELETYAKTAVSYDGRIHASFVPAYKDEDGTGKGLAGTWRITAKDPNLQNQPKNARKIYVPDEGFTFIGADYSQLEARILAGLSGDDALQAACEGGIHDRNAALLGVDKVRAKNGFYGWSYLAGPRTLYNTFRQNGYHVPYKECEALLQGFDAIYERAARFRAEFLALAKARRYVENPFGFRRYFPHTSFPAPAAMATLIQSTGAFMMWTVLPQLREAMEELGGKLLLMVHDDVLCQVPKEKKDAGLSRIQEIMQQPFNNIGKDFYVPASPKFSDKSWGDLQEL